VPLDEDELVEAEDFSSSSGEDDISILSSPSQENLLDRSESIFARIKSLPFVKKLNFDKEVDKKGNAEKSYSVFTDKWALATTNLYASIGFVYTMLDEILPLWAVLDFSQGGPSFSTTQIGIALGLNGISNIIIVLFIYPALAARLGAVKTFWVGGVVFIPLIILLPFTGLLGEYPYVLWPTLMVMFFWRSMAAQMQFSSVMALISNSVDYEHLGAANGVGMYPLIKLHRSIL